MMNRNRRTLTGFLLIILKCCGAEQIEKLICNNTKVIQRNHSMAVKYLKKNTDWVMTIDMLVHISAAWSKLSFLFGVFQNVCVSQVVLCWIWSKLSSIWINHPKWWFRAMLKIILLRREIHIQISALLFGWFFENKIFEYSFLKLVFVSSTFLHLSHSFCYILAIA